MLTALDGTTLKMRTGFTFFFMDLDSPNKNLPKHMYQITNVFDNLDFWPYIGYNTLESVNFKIRILFF